MVAEVFIVAALSSTMLGGLLVLIATMLLRRIDVILAVLNAGHEFSRDDPEQFLLPLRYAA